MIIAFIAGIVVAASGVAYLGAKYHSSSAVLVAVKAEIAKVEPSASAEVVLLVSKLKGLLGL
jgi:hypothetical protein